MPMRREAFLARVQERGEYETTEEAARVVLALLGAHLAGTVRAEFAARLPETYALILLNPLQAAEPLSPERFVRATAAWIEGRHREDGPVGHRRGPVHHGRRRGRRTHPRGPPCSSRTATTSSSATPAHLTTTGAATPGTPTAP